MNTSQSDESNISYKLHPLYKAVRINVGAAVFLENFGVLFVLHGSTSLNFALRYFLLNLSTSDMLSGLIFTYHSAVFDLDEIQSILVECKLRTMLVTYFTLTTNATVTAFSVERVIALYKPFRYHRWITKKTMAAILTTVWVVPLFIVLLAYEVFSKGVQDGCHFSDMASSRTYLILSGVRLMLTTVTVMSQLCLLIEARRHIKRIVPTLVGSNLRGVTMRMHLKVTMTTIVLVIPYVICWLPLFLGYFYLGVHPHVKAQTDWKNFMSFGLTLYIGNDAINPIIYCWRLPQVRRILHGICLRVVARC